MQKYQNIKTCLLEVALQTGREKSYIFIIKWTNIFLKPYEHSHGNLKFELDLSNCQIKAELKTGTGVDTSSLATKPELVTRVNAVKVSSTSELVSKLCNISGKKYQKEDA